MKFLTYERFKENAESNLIDQTNHHWKSYDLRWQYHKRAIEIIKHLDIDNPSDVLEIGAMGGCLVDGSETLDFDKCYMHKAFNPTILHDLRNVPLPIKTKRYKLVIALRVLQHAIPKQKEAFLELKRIAENVLIVCPAEYKVNQGITAKQFAEWSNHLKPIICEQIFDKNTFLYCWGNLRRPVELFGDLIATGLKRQIYEYRPDPSYIIKAHIDIKDILTNKREHGNYLKLKEKYSKWIAPCYMRDEYLVMRRTGPLPDNTANPERIPVFFRDIKRENWGLLDGNLVLHDYEHILEVRDEYKGFTVKQIKGWH